METNFNFKSSACTSREQSERLLALGLKKDTADMAHEWVYIIDDWIVTPFKWDDNNMNEFRIPAWSLDRLKELYKCVGDTSLWNLDDVNYDRLIQCIGLAIKHGNFNKEYLV